MTEQHQRQHPRHAVITGLGAVTCLGHDVPALWDGLVAGRSGIDRITRFDPTGLRNERGGQVRDWRFAPDEFDLDAAPDEATQFLLVAAREAWRDAGLGSRADLDRVGAIASTNFGGGPSWEEYVRRSVAQQPTGRTFAEFAFATGLAYLARTFGLQGPTTLLSIACASGTAALGCALDWVRAGRADVVLAAGHDVLAPTVLAGLSILGTMTKEEIRPFSATRSGTLFGEGAGVLVVEAPHHAAARGARVYAELLGSCQTNNAYHMTAPDKGARGMIRVLSNALADAGVEPRAVDYINAHGTGTKPHDPEETHAIKAVLGERAAQIPVSSIKAAVAHTMGAAGAVEAIATVKALAEGVIPPTLNYEEPDPECDLDYVPNQARRQAIGCAASISAGIGGSNACVVLRRPGDGEASP